MTQTFISPNLVFDCQGIGADGRREQGVVTFTTTVYGQLLSTTTTAEALTMVTSVTGSVVLGKVISGSPPSFVMSVPTNEDDILIEKFKDSFVKWSNIGSADFTIDRSNIAGEMPMDWDGAVYDIRKLDGKLVVYGANGVSVMTPHERAFGLQTIYTVGLKNKNAVCGDAFTHYFIDKLGQMWKMSNQLEKLDYSEFLGSMNALVMSWDNEKNLIYICDGTIGYVYSPDSLSLGEGPPVITGIRYKDGTSYVTASDVIEIPYFELTTDIYDFGTRKEKTVFGVEVGINLDGSLQAAVEYRKNYREPFRSIDWVNISPEGKAYMPCFGVEFKFKLRSLKHEYFELDWFKINGVIHGFSHLDYQGRNRAS